MSEKERKRARVLVQVEAGALDLRSAAQRMGVSYRHARRLFKRWRSWGEGGLVHGLRDMPSNRRIDKEARRRALAICRERYGDFGPTLACEKLREEHGIALSDETLRKWLLAEGLWQGRRAARRHRKRRARRECFGELVQLDGSHHDWFEGRAKECCAMVMVDDATGWGLAQLAEEETTEAAFRILREWIVRHGIPGQLYTDAKNVYVVDRDPNEEERRLGCGPLTDFGRACWRLGIELITAHSPQAKGRVERRNGLLQDRLVKELRLRGVSSIEGANAMLPDYLKDLNERFCRKPAREANAHRALPEGQRLEEFLCWESERTVARDWTISYEGCLYQIERQKNLPAPKDKVKVRRYLDGSLAILHGDRKLLFTQLPGSRRKPAGAEAGRRAA
jgi:transposase